MKLVYTYTDEAPALATHSFLPIIEAFAGQAGVEIELRDISLAGRILAQFPNRLDEDQRISDALAELGDLAKTPEANIIKLPNISASLPQLKAAIKELQDAGYAVPDYPDQPQTDEEREAREAYDRVKGSAVNPVLREGNSDRRAPASVKAFARKHPHSMGAWSKDSKTHVSTMSDGDFRSTEKSVTLEREDELTIEHEASDGTVTTLKSSLAVKEGEIVDAAVMRRKALDAFLEHQVQEASDQGVLFSLHLKATMMKVSDPIIFGHGVRAYFADVFERFGDQLPSPNNGLGAVLKAIEGNEQIEAAFKQGLANGPALAMVDSDRGITNLHVPSDIIIDASMPAMIRTSGQMWNADGAQQDAKAVIPDSSYAALYAETVNFCREHGAFDPATMGTTPNVGLMAQKAEEYGSHDKTFEIESAGVVRIKDRDGNVLISHEVDAGDIWRACQTKDAPVQDWVRLAVERARATGSPAVFWLDETRAHDAEVLKKVRRYLRDHDTDGLRIEIMPVAEATRFTLARAKANEDTISVTGNVLRDYLTDLFPILELGTSAKMLSIVPLMNGGGLFETGAGGSAPKHVQQLVKENHLRWDSLGEFLALAVSLEKAGAKELADALDKATGRLLENGRSPSRKVGEVDNRGSHFYLALYWAQELAEVDESFKALAERLEADEETILAELSEVQGQPVELGGYYFVDRDKATAIMRPSETFNAAIDSLLSRVSERTGYPAGAFSWSELVTSDANGAKAFYTALFGWSYEDSPIGDGMVYSMALLDGRYVGALYQSAEQAPHWNCYVTVDDVDEVASRAGDVVAEPFDVMDSGRMAVIRDPTGALLHLWQPRDHIGAGVVNADGALTWNDLTTPDPEAAATYYAELLGWTTMDVGHGYRVIRNGERSNGGMMEHGGPAAWTPYFGCSDVDALLGRISDLGGRTLNGPMDVPNGRLAVVADAQGAVFCVLTGAYDD